MTAQLALDVETWADIPGYEGTYQVSDVGRVRSLDRVIIGRDGRAQRWKGRILKLNKTNGYLSINLPTGMRHVQRLVLLAFVGPPPAGCAACHKNDVRTDNRLCNLYWGTQSDNMFDAVRNGRNHQTKKTHCGKCGAELNRHPRKDRKERYCAGCTRKRDRENLRRWRVRNRAKS